MIHYAVDAIKASLDDLPGVPRTYFGNIFNTFVISSLFLNVMMMFRFVRKQKPAFEPKFDYS